MYSSVVPRTCWSCGATLCGSDARQSTCPGCASYFTAPSTIPAVTLTLIAANTAVSILTVFFPDNVVAFGADWGLKTLSGEWWRLFTSIFIQQAFWHLFGNMFVLWLFGKRLEKILGSLTFVLFYLSCGLAGEIVSLAVDPELLGYGASGAIFGLAGGLVGIYGLKIKVLSKREFWKLAFLCLWVILETCTGPVPGIDGAAHVGGLLTGLIRGTLLVSGRKTLGRRSRVFGVMAGLLLVSAISVRQAKSYVVHLGAASRALDQGRTKDASRELHAALRIRPDARLAPDLIRDLKGQGGTRSSCTLLATVVRSQAFHDNPCEGRQCDGAIHKIDWPDGTNGAYQGTREIHNPNIPVANRTTTLTIQALDDFGEIGCTFRTTRVQMQTDSHRDVKGEEFRTDETVSSFDPQAVNMRAAIFGVKR